MKCEWSVLTLLIAYLFFSLSVYCPCKATRLMNDKAEENPKPASGPKIGEQRALKHGLTSLKKAVNTLGNRALDKRTMAGRALAQWRQDLIRDLDGDVSIQQDAIISLAVKTKLMLDSVDVWILQQPTLINKPKRAIIPVVVQRQQLADALARYQKSIGHAPQNEERQSDGSTHQR